tara:strand:+ start:642 stop:812 length:171 start_codon:yes stop_codon:yes gene_type:complete
MNAIKRQKRAKQARKNQNKWRASKKFKSSINRIMHKFIGMSKKEAKKYVKKYGLPQ